MPTSRNVVGKVVPLRLDCVGVLPFDKVLNVDATSENHGPGEGPYVYDYGYDEVDRLTSACAASVGT